MVLRERLSSIFVVSFLQYIVGAFLIIALLNRQHDLILLTILILGIMIGARLWSRFSLPGIFTRASLDKHRAFPDEILHFDIHAENRKWLPVRLYMDMPAEGALERVNKDGFKNECSLLWYQKANFQWEFACRHRGVHRVGPPHIEAGDLFGFFSRRQKEEKEPVHVIVYPRLIPIKPFSFLRKDFFGEPGAKSPVQDPIYMLGTRDYQHWQPARYIHWKASARHNRLQEKVFEPSAQEKILLMLDVASFKEHNARDDFERTLEAVASMAVQCDKKGYASGFLTNGVIKGASGFLPVSRGQKKLSAILENLARLQMESGGSFTDVLLHGLPISWGISAVCFSYMADKTLHNLEELFLHRRRHLIFVVCKTPSENQGFVPGIRKKVFTLDEICIKEPGS